MINSFTRYMNGVDTYAIAALKFRHNMEQYTFVTRVQSCDHNLEELIHTLDGTLSSSCLVLVSGREGTT